MKKMRHVLSSVDFSRLLQLNQISATLSTIPSISDLIITLLYIAEEDVIAI